MGRKSLYWFRRDLRWHDNELLHRAVQESDELCLLYCFDPKDWSKSSFGFERTAEHRARFLLESLGDLKTNLAKKSLSLQFVWGAPEKVIPEAVHSESFDCVYFHYLVTSEERRSEEAIRRSLNGLCSVQSEWTHCLYKPQNFPHSVEDLPPVFSAFRRKLEKLCEPRPLSQEPVSFSIRPRRLKIFEDELEFFQNRMGVLPSSSPFALFEFKGGETSGQRRVKDYLWRTNQVAQYKETRNQLIGADFSSKFSAWLAMGCLSPRWILEELRAYESKRTKNASTYWLYFELLWREYFQWVAYQANEKLFAKGGVKDRSQKTLNREDWIAAWCEGKTGVPFIDANMRELNETGFMSNRGRQNVASFLVNELALDWRVGAEYFESKLIDYDPASNWGNWAYLAGVGQDPRDRRAFNIIKQAQTYDPQGEFVFFWIPDLRQLPSTWVHQPHLMPGASSRPRDGSSLDLYFNPIVRLRSWHPKSDRSQKELYVAPKTSSSLCS